MRAYRQALGRFPTGVAFVATVVDGRPLGLVVSSLTSVSLAPPLVAFCPARTSHTWRRMRSAGRFAVSILGEEHAAYVRRATPPGADRFTGADVALSPSGLPVIRGALATLDCDLHAEHEAGDHTIVLGAVRHLGTRADGRPLVFWSGALGRLAA